MDHHTKPTNANQTGSTMRAVRRSQTFHTFHRRRQTGETRACTRGGEVDDMGRSEENGFAILSQRRPLHLSGVRSPVGNRALSTGVIGRLDASLSYLRSQPMTKVRIHKMVNPVNSVARSHANQAVETDVRQPKPQPQSSDP